MAYFVRGVSYFSEQKWLNAIADFDKAGAPGKPEEFARLYVCVAQQRLGKGDAGRKDLRAYLAHRQSLPPGDLFSNLAAFLLGDIDEAALFSSAQTADETKTRQHLCETWYFAGTQRLAAGQTAAAEEAFQKCLATGEKAFVEYGLATAELKALGK
jgi:lipoprotein NlpI